MKPNLEVSASADLVVEGLYLGDRVAACSTDLLRRLHITRIVSVDLVPLLPVAEVRVLRISIQDTPDEDLLTHLDEATDFIDEGLRGSERVLVHCFHGMSRSAAVTAAYLMRSRGLNTDSAMLTVRQARPCVQPNEGFLEQLRVYEAAGCSLSSPSKALTFHIMSLVQDASQEERQDAVRKRLDVCAGGVDSDGVDSIIYRCRKCRKVLFGERDVLPHAPGRSVSWMSLAELEKNGKERTRCPQGVFVVPFLAPVQTTNERLVCAHCSAKLGSHSWSAATRCACAAEARPGFIVNRARVDVSVSRPKLM